MVQFNTAANRTNHTNNKILLLVFNSREAIAAIIGDIVVFYNSKNLNCIGALSFLRLEEEYWRSPFF